MGLRDYQVNLVAEVGQHFRRGAGGVCMVLGTGGGKCLARGTPVMMHSGEVRLVEDIAVGDLLMGPDSQPRRVESLARGREMMYRVTPTKGDAYTVNESHILSLRHGSTGEIANVPVLKAIEMLSEPASDWYGWRVPRILHGNTKPQKDFIRVISKTGVDDYFGFELSGPDRLFLLGDFTVTHNTRTASYMVGKWAERNQQVGWLVHRQELLMQAAMTFAEYGIEHRLVCSDSDARAIKAQQFREFGRSFVKHDALTVVGTVQTVARHLESVAGWFNPAMLVADECHLSMAAGWVKVLTRWEKTKLLGLTGTPERLDGKALGRSSGGLYDEMVLGPSVGEMIENGYLAPYRLWRPNVHLNQVDLKMKGKDYDAATLEKELEGPVIFGDVIGHYRRYAHGTPAIGFCPTVASAKHFAAAFADAGYRAVSIDGMTDDALRRRTLAALGTGDLDVVFNCGILTEGTDIPLATTAIMLRRTLSLAMYLQSVGRVLRTHERKDYARVIDCVGVSLIHGYPDDEREWSLDGRPKKKRGESEREIELMRCPSCWEEHLPRKTCPACGYSYGEDEVVRRNKEMQQVDAELVEVSEDQRRAEQAEKRRKIGRARTIDELKDLALELGYSKGWAYRIYEARKQKEGVAA